MEEKQLLESVTGMLDANGDRDVIVISRGVNRELHRDLTKAIREEKRYDKCTLYLTTNGGDPDGAFRIARCLRHHYTHLRIVIPSYCKSAGTLIAIVADELAIGDLGELGPLDIQVPKDSELAGRSSGLDIIQAMNAAREHTQRAFKEALIDIRGARLSTKLAGEFATKIAVGVAAPLYAQIDPIRLAEMQRAMRIAYEYGKRLNEYTNSLANGALASLVADYPAHGFVIDRKEASTLFTTVVAPTAIEDKFCTTLGPILNSQVGFGPHFIRAHASQTEGNENGSSTEGTGQHSEQNPTKPVAGNVPRGTKASNGQGRTIRGNGRGSAGSKRAPSRKGT